MSALTAARDTQQRNAQAFTFPVAAATFIQQGSLVCLDSTGFAVSGATATTLKCVGRAEQPANNLAGSAGAMSLKVMRGCFSFANSAAADAIALKDVGATCYLVDDQTVALTNGTNTRSAAGIIRDVDSNGVWVEI